MGEKNTLKVSLGGYEYTLKSEDSPAHLNAVAQRVDAKIHAVKEHFPKYPFPKTALLTALQLADELLKLEEEYRQLMELAEEAGF
jgi:cell division protein ZapA